MAPCAAIQVWIRGVITELGLNGFQLSKDASPTILNMDSKSAIDLAQNPGNHKKLKHIRINYQLGSIMCQWQRGQQIFSAVLSTLVAQLTSICRQHA